MDPEKVNYHYCDDLSTSPWPEGTRVLVTGAAGYVAHRLIPELVARGYIVRCMYRNKSCPPFLIHPRIEHVYADCLKMEELLPTLKDVDYAYYLIHSMRLKKEEFIAKDQKAAKNFRESAQLQGVKQIIYLGGLGEKNDRMSPHLRSRREVGIILSQGPVPVIRVRAAIIIGTGSTSYELMKSLTLHNRFIPFLPEFNSVCQPVAIRDVVKYLVGVMETPGLSTRIFQIGGKDVLTYKEMLMRFAKIMNRRVRFIDIAWMPVPVDWMCRIYAYWLHCFISIPVNITALLLSSLKTDVVCGDKEISTILPFEPLDFVTAVEWAQEKERRSMVFSHWSDVSPQNMSDLLPLCEFESSEFIIDEHVIEIPVPPEQVFPVVCQIGDKHGWNHANILWKIRGLLDRVLGGVGLQRGRRDPGHLRVGDSVDFWRVEKLEPNRELLLRAEMITPGLSWLQFQLEPNEGGTRLTLRAHFIPKPFWGNLYWLILSYFHPYIFKGMLECYRVKSLERITNQRLNGE
jgi:uncharacterized protein YbjT (DUF2867 family)/uncharacterized protein YndB with AHSA1/START domain